MTDAGALLREVEQDTSPAARVWRLRRTLTTDRVALLCLVAPFCFLVPADYLAHPDVVDATIGICSLSLGGLLLVFLPLVVALRFTNSHTRFALASWALRQAARSGNDDMMAPTVDQPRLATTDGPALDRHGVKNVRWLDNYRGGRLRCVVGLLAISIQFPCLVLLPISLIDSWSGWSVGTTRSLPPHIAFLSVIEFVSVVVVSGIIPAVVFLALQRLRTVSADDEGLSWKAGLLSSRRERIAWSQARSFVKVSFHNQALSGSQTAYILDASAAMLQWGHDPIYGVTRNEAGAKRLVALVASHTGLPLRAATPLAKDVAKTLGGFNGNNWAKKLAVSSGEPLPPRIAGLAGAFDALAIRRTRFWLLVGLACLPALVYCVLSVWVLTRG